MDLDDIKAALKDRAEELALYLFPQGRRNGREWQIGDVQGNPGGSLSISIGGIKAGAWKDFSSGETGTLLDLWAMHYGFHGAEGWVARAGEECASWLGGTFEKRGAPEQPRPAQKPKAPAAKPTKPAPTSRRQPDRFPTLPPYTEEWNAAVTAFNEKAAEALHSQRGYSHDFIAWLKEQKLIGLHQTKWGPALALPVLAEDGTVIAAHVKNRQTKDNAPTGAPPWQYLYHGDTSPGTRPLIIGDVTKAPKIWVFESQWDAFAVIDRLGLHSPEQDWPPIALFITRGASNGRLCNAVAVEGKTLVLWPQNDEPTEKGIIPAEEWVKSIVEVAGAIPVRRVNTPTGYEDPNDWLLKSPEVDVGKIFEAISQAPPARASKLPPVRDMAFAIRPENRTPAPPEVIKGLLHRGSKMVVGGTSKGRKSFSLLDLAVSVATGTPWWGFPCERGRVLYLNFEIQQPFLEGRVLSIASAKKVQMPMGSFHAMTLRGNTTPFESMSEDLIDYLLSMEPYSLIIADPVYKLMSGKDENKAGDVTFMLGQLEKVSVRTGAAVAFGAHYSKGNQAAKESIDRIGGSGAFARDPDAILTMTAHKQEDAFTVESTLRNFAPIDPFVVTWLYPLFERDDSGLDPADLKQPRSSKDADRSNAPAPARKNDTLMPALQLLVHAYAEAIPRAMHWGQLVAAGAELLKVSESSAKRYAWRLKEEAYIEKKERGLWVTTTKGDAYCDEHGPQPTPVEPTTEPDPELPLP